MWQVSLHFISGKLKLGEINMPKSSTLACSIVYPKSNDIVQPTPSLLPANCMLCLYTAVQLLSFLEETSFMDVPAWVLQKKNQPGDLAKVWGAAGKWSPLHHMVSWLYRLRVSNASSESMIIPCRVLVHKPGLDQQPKRKSPCLLGFAFLWDEANMKQMMTCKIWQVMINATEN